MRCVKCRRATQYKSISSGRCPGCGHEFVFFRKRGDPITDIGFAGAVATVNGAMGFQWLPEARQHWLRTQLYYEVCRRIQRRKVIPRKRVPIDYRKFESLFGRWSRVNGWPEGEIGAVALANVEAEEEAAPDAGSYSFQRILVCDGRPIVDFLLANRFHLDASTPVFAVDRYPEQVYEKLEPALWKNPPREILVLHKAETSSCLLPERIRDARAWFSDTGTVVDVGLRPRQAKKLGAVRLPSLSSAGIPESWPRRERSWLAKHQVELEAVRPATLLSVLGAVVRGEAKREEGDGGGADGPFVFIDPGTEFGDDSG